LISLYEVPQTYLELLPQIPPNLIYDNKLDVRSEYFDPALALFSRRIIAPQLIGAQIFDNMSKAKHLVPGSGVDPIFRTYDGSIDQKGKAKAPKQAHIFQILSRKACGLNSTEKDVPQEQLREALQKSPLALLWGIMKERRRARVIIRNRNR